MGCSRLPPTGDRGQRYEVRYRNLAGEEKVFGWASTMDGAQGFLQAIALWPAAQGEGWIVDRQEVPPNGL